MNIAINIIQGDFGGITTTNRGLVNLINKNGDNVFGLDFSDQYSPEVDQTDSPNIRKQFSGYRVVFCKGGYSIYPWSGIKALKNEWKQQIEDTKQFLLLNDIQVVFISGGYFGPWILSVAAKALGLPVVLRYAGVLSKEMLFENKGTSKNVLACERAIAKSAAHIIYPSALCKKIVEKTILKATAIRSSVIPNPLTYPVLSRYSNTRFDGMLKSIAFVGRWNGIKNPQAFVDLHNWLLNDRWSHRAYIVTSSKKINDIVPESIERVPQMSHDDVYQFYKSVGLIVVPSVFETFCNVAAEALFVGTPVLVSENVGISSYLQEAGLGRMVIKDFSDIEAVALATKKLCGTKISAREQKALRKILNTKRSYENIVHVIKSVDQD
jgi:glycosyltransferase involved in cell wall biosynthesis